MINILLNKIKKTPIIIIIVSIIILLFIISNMFFKKKENSIKTITRTINIKSISKFIARRKIISEMYTNVFNGTKYFMPTTFKIQHIAICEIKSFIDLNKMNTEKDIIVDKQSIIVKLPQIEIDVAKLADSFTWKNELESMEVYHPEYAKFEAQTINMAFTKARLKAMRDTIFINKAKLKVQSFFESFFFNLGFKKVNIVFAGDTQSIQDKG